MSGRTPVFSEQQRSAIIGEIVENIISEHQKGRGYISDEDLSRIYGIGSSETIRNWIRKAVTRGLISEEIVSTRRQHNLQHRATDPKKRKLSKEDRQVLVELVWEEIQAHREGRLERLSTNSELRTIAGNVGERTIASYLGALSTEDRRYRVHTLGQQSGALVNEVYGNLIDRVSVEIRKANGRRNGKKVIAMYGNPSRDMTREQRATIGRRGWETMRRTYGNYVDHATPEQLEARYHKTLGTWDPKKRSEVARRNGQRNGTRMREEGKGIFGLTREQRQAAGKKGGAIGGRLGGTRGGPKGGRRTYELYGCPFERYTDEQRSEIGRKGAAKSSEALRKTRYLFNGIYFDSQGEAATAVVLEKYVQGFRIEEGKTFQVRTRSPKTIDFLVGDTFVEYHPTLVFHGKNKLGDIATRGEYESFKKTRDKLKEESPERMRRFKEEYKQVIRVNYRAQREQAIAQSEEYAGHNLIVVETPEELYDQVMIPLGTNIPSRESFVSEFNQTMKEVKKANSKKGQSFH